MIPLPEFIAATCQAAFAIEYKARKEKGFCIAAYSESSRFSVFPRGAYRPSCFTIFVRRVCDFLQRDGEIQVKILEIDFGMVYAKTTGNAEDLT